MFDFSKKISSIEFGAFAALYCRCATIHYRHDFGRQISAKVNDVINILPRSLEAFLGFFSIWTNWKQAEAGRRGRGRPAEPRNAENDRGKMFITSFTFAEICYQNHACILFYRLFGDYFWPKKHVMVLRQTLPCNKCSLFILIQCLFGDFWPK